MVWSTSQHLTFRLSQAIIVAACYGPSLNRTMKLLSHDHGPGEDDFAPLDLSFLDYLIRRH